jgi:CpeT protein
MTLNRIRTVALALPLLFPLAGCYTIKGEPGAKPVVMPAALQAGELMAGSYSSAAQAKADPDFRDVRLHMVRIWPERTDAYWLYVEQAMATSLDKPYRQRVYAVKVEPDGKVASHVYELPGDPMSFAGAWQDPKRLDLTSPELLTPREGCTVFLEADGEGWKGATRPNTCVSNLMGAAYATSEVTVGRDALTSWDRGFDAAGKQVWGSTKGAYRFVRE